MTRKNRLSLNKTIKFNKPQLFTINNYTFYLLKNTSNLATCQSYILSGFINENKKNLGINHLLEHILTDSLPKCKNSCFYYLKKKGLDYNASTNHNVLTYYVTGHKKHLVDMLDYILTISTKPDFNKLIIDREKKAVANELMGYMEKPTYHILNSLLSELFNLFGLKNSMNYKLQLNNLKSINEKTLLNYYNKNYGSNNTIFIISGNFKITDIIKLAKPLLPLNKVINLNIPSKPCLSNKSIQRFIHNPKLVKTQIMIVLPVKYKYNDDNMIVLSVVLQLLQLYLFKLLRITHKLVYGISLLVESNICTSWINIYLTTKNADFQLALNVISYGLNHFLSSETLLEGVIDKILVNQENIFYNSNSIASFYGQQILYNKFINTPILSHSYINKKIKSITKNDIKHVFNDTFMTNNYICCVSNKHKKTTFKFFI